MKKKRSTEFIICSDFNRSVILREFCHMEVTNLFGNYKRNYRNSDARVGIFTNVRRNSV